MVLDFARVILELTVLADWYTRNLIPCSDFFPAGITTEPIEWVSYPLINKSITVDDIERHRTFDDWIPPSVALWIIEELGTVIKGLQDQCNVCYNDFTHGGNFLLSVSHNETPKQPRLAVIDFEYAIQNSHVDRKIRSFLDLCKTFRRVLQKSTTELLQARHDDLTFDEHLRDATSRLNSAKSYSDAGKQGMINRVWRELLDTMKHLKDNFGSKEENNQKVCDFLERCIKVGGLDIQDWEIKNAALKDFSDEDWIAPSEQGKRR